MPREYINPYLVMEQLEQMLECYECGSFHGRSYRELLDGVAVHIVPMVNPDGIAVSQFGEGGLRSPELVQVLQACYAYDTASGRTKSSYAGYLARWKANAHGTDLNKNFITGFGSDAKTLLPSYAGYPGAAPLYRAGNPVARSRHPAVPSVCYYKLPFHGGSGILGHQGKACIQG